MNTYDVTLQGGFTARGIWAPSKKAAYQIALMEYRKRTGSTGSPLSVSISLRRPAKPEWMEQPYVRRRAS